MSYLTQKEYNISGNVFRAFYDVDGKLVFVIDDTITDFKLNALLVINPVGDRKWNDILSNDYGVDLETVRPKKDNKYQKLDIEYSGLSVYDNLIHSVGNRTEEAENIQQLNEFRQNSIRKSAQERLEVAETKAEKTKETIIKTNESISDLQGKLKAFRSTLSQQRKQIGKEPTKKSAAKILRTEAQIDATNEKIRRAKKRLTNAQRRLVVAEEDAELARDVLSRIKSDEAFSSKTLPAVQKPSELVVKQTVPVPDLVDKEPAWNEDVRDEEDIELENALNKATEEYNFEVEQNLSTNSEQKATNMAEDEVKPLFDKDPEILDEEIAFKPINFDESVNNKVAPEAEVKKEVFSEKEDNVAPLSFVPPVSNTKQEKAEEKVEESAFAPIEIKPVTDYQNEVKNNSISEDVNDAVNNTSFVSPVVNEAPQNYVKEPEVNETVKENNFSNDRKNVISPAPVSSDFRPVSPITGAAAPSAPVQRKPTLMYYIMLILLIALSIFTLWLYQKKTNNSEGTPDLVATVPLQDENQESEDVVIDASESPFIEPVSVEETPVAEVKEEPVEPQITEPLQETETVAETVEVKPEPVPVTVEDTEIDTTVQDVAVPATDVPAEPVIVQPVVQTAAPLYEEPKPEIQSEEEIIASKPAYNVSQNEKMFVADSNYETDAAPYYEDEVVEDMPMCPDGTAPDTNGCCTGEIYTDMGEYGFNCCPEAGGDCFPPLF